MKNRLIGLLNRTLDLSIEDTRKADIMGMILSSDRVDDENCVFRQFARDYVKGIPDNTSSSYIECGGLQWALQNAGTDTENPNGKLYTWDEALTIENDLWKLPTHDEQEMFLARTRYGFDKKRGVGVFVDRKTGVQLELPANGWGDEAGALRSAGTYGSYWSSEQYNPASAYYIYFDSSSVNTNSLTKTYGRSVRCVRR